MAGARLVGLVVVVIVVGALGCRTPPVARPMWPDPALELTDDTDRDQATDALWVLPPGAARDAARAPIAVAAAAKIAEALDEEQPFVAAERLEELAALWQSEPSRVGSGLAGQVALLHRLRAEFAKSGSLAAVTLVFVLLAEVEPARRTEYLAELDLVLGFADELAIADIGPQARRAQPIALLQPSALTVPLPWVVDRYVKLLGERQIAVSTMIAQSGATLEIVRAHPDLLRTGRRIATTLARANRASEIHRHLVNVRGIGSDRELSLRAEVVAEQPTADAYAALAAVLRSDDKLPDHTASLMTCLAGLARFPTDARLMAAAAGDARTLGRIDQPIALYTAAVRAAREVDPGDAIRLGRLYAERITRDAAGGRPGAAQAAWQTSAKFIAEAARRHPHGVWSQVTALAESALGRGLLGQGLIEDATGALERSIERAPSIDAFEALAILNLQLGRLDLAARWAASGLELLGDTTSGDRYRRAKLERLAGDIARRAGTPELARRHYLDAMRTFGTLGEDKDLPRPIAAERTLERGRALWWMGEPERAVEDLIGAVAIDPDTPLIATTAVGFLLQVGKYADAVDAYHDALGSTTIGELSKIYMSLWVLGDARWRGEPRDRLANDYLVGRSGGVWYELLAEAATGRLDVSALRAAATTGPRKAELAFYRATLGLDPAAATPAGARALLEQVIAARLVMDAEYDLARAYLATPAAAPAPTAVAPAPASAAPAPAPATAPVRR